MKNLVFYYIIILLPIPVLIGLSYNSKLFLTLIIFYYFFRGFTDGQRLLDKKMINKSDFWKIFIPFWRSKFYKELYFEK